MTNNKNKKYEYIKIACVSFLMFFFFFALFLVALHFLDLLPLMVAMFRKVMVYHNNQPLILLIGLYIMIHGLFLIGKFLLKFTARVESLISRDPSKCPECGQKIK